MSNQTRQTIGIVMTGLVLIAALAGLIVAIQNLQPAVTDCTIRSFSIAYIVFFVIAVLSMLGLGTAIFKATDLGATAGGTILAFSSLALFVIAVALVFNSGKINKESSRNANYAVFGIFALLAVINTAYIFSQRGDIVSSQPANQIQEYLQNRMGRSPSMSGTNDFETTYRANRAMRT